MVLLALTHGAPFVVALPRPESEGRPHGIVATSGRPRTRPTPAPLPPSERARSAAAPRMTDLGAGRPVRDLINSPFSEQGNASEEGPSISPAQGSAAASHPSLAHNPPGHVPGSVEVRVEAEGEEDAGPARRTLRGHLEHIYWVVYVNVFLRPTASRRAHPCAATTAMIQQVASRRAAASGLGAKGGAGGAGQL